MYWEALAQWLAGTRLVRRLADALFRGRARRRLAVLDRVDAARRQAQTLRGLIHQAHATRFGREHDFGRIRTPTDFRRLVPLRTPLDFWRDYWQPAFPDLSDTTWPGPIPALIAQPVPTLPYMPAPPALWASHRVAALTTLSLLSEARPQARLFRGQMLVVNEGPPTSLLAAGVQAGGAAWLALQDLPPRHRPFTVAAPACVDPGCSAEGRIRALVQRSVKARLTLVAGQTETLKRFFELCRKETGWRSAADLWPDLAAVVYQAEPGDGGATGLAPLVGGREGRPPVLLLEALFRPEAAIAVEDPRHGCLRLLPDLGVYFEFVPVDEVGRSRPVRLGVGDVEPGVPYLLAVSSPAGVWGCLAGLRVAFERRDPPLLRVLGPEQPRPALSDKDECFTPRPVSHPQNGDTAAGPPGTSARTPSSAPADRG